MNQQSADALLKAARAFVSIPRVELDHVEHEKLVHDFVEAIAAAERSREMDSIVCGACHALGGNCCQAAADRREMADSLTTIVDRQAQAITILRRERDEARTVIADLRAKRGEG